ncbi:MAG: cytochrome c3 family protein [Bacteroidales bacterium]
MEKSLVLFVLLPLISIFSILNMAGPDNKKKKSDRQTPSQNRDGDVPKCTDCHASFPEKQIMHAPVKEGCITCHLTDVNEHPGDTSQGLQLSNKVPELCFSCHAELKQDIDTARLVHRATVTKRRCLNCHAPHSSDEKKLLVRNKKELCLTCHNKDLAPNGTKILNIQQLLKNSSVIHPALAGGCTSCHKPHSSTENFLLISAYPSGQYAPGKKDNYAICWECHDSDLLELETTSTSTSFRSGERNLHYVHLHGEKGRSCSICHDVHATKRKHLIIEKTPFGSWDLPLNYLPADSGGSCSPGCHRMYTYKR